MFTPAISAAFNVMEQDVGRPIDHIAYKLDSPNLLTDVNQVLNTAEAREVEVQSSDGSVYLQRIQPYRDEHEHITGIVLTTTDITALKEAEQAQRTMMTLAQINEELPDFAYAVSHDLQAPLRHISQYSEILQSAQAGEDSEKFTKATKVIGDSAAMLRTMIDGLLAYSRINTRGRPLNRVPLDDVIDDAIQDLFGSIEYHKAEIDACELPTVSGDREQLQTLFFHLLDNAIKYRGEEAPQITVRAELQDTYVQISVQDNGIGIEERHAERIFTIFKRLGYREEVPGVGVGLALCKRIVIRHGGRIWLESLEKGARFCFTLRCFRDRTSESGRGDKE
jgi:two-component system CheB/CheR fusion protein